MSEAHKEQPDSSQPVDASNYQPQPPIPIENLTCEELIFGVQARLQYEVLKWAGGDETRAADYMAEILAAIVSTRPRQG